MGILAAIGAWVAEFLSSSVARFLAMKLLLTTLFIVVLPIVLNNFLYFVVHLAISHINSAFSSSGVHSYVLHLAGLAGYIAMHLQLTSLVSVLLTAVALRFTFKVFHVA